MTIDHGQRTGGYPHSTPAAAILDTLQERMERIIRGESPNTGRFCGYCYARLEKDQDVCPVCATATSAVAPVDRIPRDALRVYNVYRRKMQLWVNFFAFAGILLSLIITGFMIALLPNPWNFLAVAMMFFGSWYLANLLGGGFGAYLGAHQGRPLRNRAWQTLLERRAAGEDIDRR